MPTIPDYNQGFTEEAELSRAKKRVNEREMEKFSEISEYPDTDPTDGGAEQIATKLWGEMESLQPIYTAISAFIKPGGQQVGVPQGNTIFLSVQSYQQAIQYLGQLYNKMRQIKEISNQVVPNLNYVSFSTVNRLKAELDKLTEAFQPGNRFYDYTQRLITRIGAATVDVVPFKIRPRNNQGQVLTARMPTQMASIYEDFTSVAQAITQAFQQYAVARQQRVPDQSEVSGSGLPAFNPRGEIILPRATGHTYRVGNPSYLENKYL